MCAKVEQIILDFVEAGAHQFFTEITWFLGNKRALSEFKYRILQHLISIINLKNN